MRTTGLVALQVLVVVLVTYYPTSVTSDGVSQLADLQGQLAALQQAVACKLNDTACTS